MKEDDLYIDLFGLRIFRIGNAAGTVRKIEELEELAVCEFVGPILVGSYTKEARPGNPGQVYWAGPDYSINVNGLPNGGAEWCKKFLPEMIKVAREPLYHPVIVSVAGFNPQEYAELAVLALESSAFGVELNLSCPNIYSADGQQKQIPCFHPDLTDKILTTVEKAVGSEAIVWVKISPCCDLQQEELLTKALADKDLTKEIVITSGLVYSLKEMAQVLLTYKIVKAVVCVNTWPNVLAVDRGGNPRLTFGQGVGGLGGPILKVIGLNQVARLRDLLSERIKVVGCGGIGTGQDILDYWDAGAALVQVGTGFLEKGVKIFDDIMWQLADMIE